MDSLGLNFVLVTPHGMMIFVADPEVANTILTRRKDFGRVDLAASKLDKLLLSDMTTFTDWYCRDDRAFWSKLVLGETDSIAHLEYNTLMIVGG